MDSEPDRVLLPPLQRGEAFGRQVRVLERRRRRLRRVGVGAAVGGLGLVVIGIGSLVRVGSSKPPTRPARVGLTQSGPSTTQPAFPGQGLAPPSALSAVANPPAPASSPQTLGISVAPAPTSRGSTSASRPGLVAEVNGAMPSGSQRPASPTAASHPVQAPPPRVPPPPTPPTVPVTTVPPPPTTTTPTTTTTSPPPTTTPTTTNPPPTTSTTAPCRHQTAHCRPPHQ